LNFNSIYTYLPTYDWVLHAYNQAAVPDYMVEANYEHANNNNIEPAGPVSTQVLRKQAYWSMLSGAMGQFYGNKNFMGFPAGWQNSLNDPGAVDMGFLASLFKSFDWYDLASDQTHVVMTAGFGTYTTGALNDPITSNNYATTGYARVATGSIAVAYIPTVRGVTFDMTKFGANVVARWFDPTNNAFTAIGTFPNTGTHVFTPTGNNSAGDSDWVLVLQGGP
ncbi:MAG TPA: DUF4038 domain-containing protein, partial [Candidatus Binataceae bacterium]|nr:DUF4038 domain-containing protein [Candidatus Binataceae bacterium]